MSIYAEYAHGYMTESEFLAAARQEDPDEYDWGWDLGSEEEDDDDDEL